MADQRVTLTLSDSLVNYLKAEAERTKSSMAEVVRGSLTQSKAIYEETGVSDRVVVQDNNGGLKTIVIPR